MTDGDFAYCSFKAAGSLLACLPLLLPTAHAQDTGSRYLARNGDQPVADACIASKVVTDSNDGQSGLKPMLPMHVESGMHDGNGAAETVSAINEFTEAADGTCIAWPANIPEGYMVIDGDLLVPWDYFQRGTHGGTRWPGGIVPFEFDANVTATQQSLAMQAMADWEAVANVDFRPRSGDANYLHIQSANFNASEGVGMRGGRHNIWIVSWTSEFIIAHEFGHALGFWHEQSRLDRNSYIRVEFQNISQTQCSQSNGDPAPCDSQFDFRGGDGEYGPYDFDSVMHYGQCSFTCCNDSSGPCGSGCGNSQCRTITTLDPAFQSVIGQRTHLSKWDKIVMSFLYPESDWWFADRTYSGLFENGTFLEPDKTFVRGMQRVPAGGTLWLLHPGDGLDYFGAGVWSTSVTLRAPLGATLR